MQRYWEAETETWQPFSGADLLVARGLGDVRVTISLPAWAGRLCGL